jgi:GrpB-like predicted nucleotidyltransferase (UPF0157 family)
VTLDEPIQIVDHDPRWFEEYRSDAAEIEIALAAWSPMLEHSGSTSVPGLAAKPIIDILVGLQQWPMPEGVPNALRPLGYEHLGEAGVPGREYFRRRRLHGTNLAVVECKGRLWNENVLLRDYLRAHPTIAAGYARAKKEAWFNGARTLLAYSEAKAAKMTALLENARRWSAG